MFLGPVFRKAVTRFALWCALGDDAPAGSQVRADGLYLDDNAQQANVAAFVLRLLSDADYEVRKCTLKALIAHGTLLYRYLCHLH